MPLAHPPHGQPPTVVVTGAARGIGAATAAALSATGHKVWGLDVLEPDLLPAGVELRRCDVSDEADVQRVLAEVVGVDARIDVLVNIAGIVAVGPLEAATWAEFRRVTDVNLGGTFLMCKHVVPVMRRQGGGVIVNLGSVSGHVGQVDHALYGATKGAISALTRALAWELAPANIRVLTVSPGSVDTPMLRSDVSLEAERTGSTFDRAKAAREAEQALGRWAAPEEVADVIAFLSGPGASFVTGADLLVDAGWVAR